MSRWKASSIHLAISAAIGSAVLALMLLVWYPYPLFAAVGGQQVLLILLGVDVTLGPLATLVIFNAKKNRKALAFDLSVIALLQASALIYGMSVVFQARPAYVAFVEDSFALVTANMLSKADFAKTGNPHFRSAPITGPAYVYSEAPVDIAEIQEVIMNELNGKGLQQLPQFYRPYTEHMAAAGKAAKPLAELRKLDPGQIAEIDDTVHTIGRAETDIGFLPLRANYRNLAVLVGKSDGKVLALLPINLRYPSIESRKDKK